MAKFVEWDEPRQHPELDYYLPITIRASVEDIAKYMRKVEPRYPTDEAAVEDFMIVNWGRMIDTDV